MSSTQAAMRQALSKEVDDYWASTTTSSGSSTTLTDTNLIGKPADWMSDGTGDRVISTIRITSGTYVGEERDFSSLAVDTGTITVDATFGGTIASGVTYEINRLFTAQEKEDAIDHACYEAFPDLYTKVHDESITFGSWLRNGCFEIWSQTTYPDKWTTSNLTAVVDANIQYVHRGSSSCKLTRGGTDGYLYQDETLQRELWDLEEKSVVFKVWVFSAVASQVRLSVLDGTDTTYSSYHTGDSTWEELEVSAAIAKQATGVEFRINVESSDTACYVDDARVVSVGGKYAYDISDLGLALNQPYQVRRVLDDEQSHYNYVTVFCWEPPTTDGLLRFRKALPDDSKLQIVGIGYLTPPTSTVSCIVDLPQTKILYALAVIYLYDLMIGRTIDSDIERYGALRSLWEKKAMARRGRFQMPRPNGTLLYV